MISALLAMKLAQQNKTNGKDSFKKSEMQEAINDPSHPRHKEVHALIADLRSKSKTNNPSLERHKESDLGR